MKDNDLEKDVSIESPLPPRTLSNPIEGGPWDNAVIDNEEDGDVVTTTSKGISNSKKNRNCAQVQDDDNLLSQSQHYDWSEDDDNPATVGIQSKGDEVEKEDPLLLAIDDLEGRIVAALEDVMLHPVNVNELEQLVILEQPQHLPLSSQVLQVEDNQIMLLIPDDGDRSAEFSALSSSKASEQEEEEQTSKKAVIEEEHNQVVPEISATVQMAPSRAFSQLPPLMEGIVHGRRRELLSGHGRHQIENTKIQPIMTNQPPPKPPPPLQPTTLQPQDLGAMYDNLKCIMETLQLANATNTEGRELAGTIQEQLQPVLRRLEPFQLQRQDQQPVHRQRQKDDGHHQCHLSQTYEKKLPLQEVAHELAPDHQQGSDAGGEVNAKSSQNIYRVGRTSVLKASSQLAPEEEAEEDEEELRQRQLQAQQDGRSHRQQKAYFNATSTKKDAHHDRQQQKQQRVPVASIARMKDNESPESSVTTDRLLLMYREEQVAGYTQQEQQQHQHQRNVTMEPNRNEASPSSSMFVERQRQPSLQWTKSSPVKEVNSIPNIIPKSKPSSHGRNTKEVFDAKGHDLTADVKEVTTELQRLATRFSVGKRMIQQIEVQQQQWDHGKQEEELPPEGVDLVGGDGDGTTTVSSLTSYTPPGRRNYCYYDDGRSIIDGRSIVA